MTEGQENRQGSSRSAQWVAAGIFLSRTAGLVREAFIGKYLGTSYAADSFRTALRMPNVLQNLLGEGTLSASFIPVYSELLEQGREEEAGRVAGAIFALLFAVAGGLALVGIVAAPVLVSVFTPGFVGDPRYDLTVSLIRIIFPMAGILVLSAWSLGVLNSHRRFFVSYVAPVAWNAAMIGALLLYGGRRDQGSLVVILAWAALLGGLLQFAVQLPFVVSVTRSLRIRWDLKRAGVRTAVRNAGPAIAGRGVIQLSGYVDLFLASMLAVGAVATLTYAQQLYILPVSLFGMSVAAAELPELSRQRGHGADVLRARVQGGLQQVAFYVIPTILGFIVIGDVLVAALYERGQFTTTDTMVTWAILAAYSLGLLASTGTRVFSSAFFALHDTRTPAKVAAVRVALSAVLGVLLMMQFGRVSFNGAELGPITIPPFAVGPYGFGLFEIEPIGGETIGPVGLGLAAAASAWLEWGLLQRSLSRRIGRVRPSFTVLGKMAAAAIPAAAVARGLAWVLPAMNHVATAFLVVGSFGLVYGLLGLLLGVAEARAIVARGRGFLRSR
ncbi:MAG TPA: murein biosynthesis integral membrane protein MurJ [Longimicrobiales bacterium]|nr:murein biosynthesis integral membrane protein MurJ [Longimicrobiales bacterium]